ncbi:MAG TPA: polysaccharide deacetylase family protein [Streptosporangiaceae bacterium]|nr:polysaccharide deacetylase family protein [Streptosporangiaceae bacterium]
MTVTTQTAPGQVPVLMYHALSSARTSGFHRWTLSADRLRSHLDFLSREGYRSVTVGGLQDCYRRGGPAPDEKLVALTFDDAYADFHDVALPLLLSYGLTGTLFVPTGYVGGRSGWMHGDGEGERTILSWAGLAEIAGCGIEIGAHSHTHPQMDRLPAAEMARQAAQPKAELEDRLGLPVATFAYPYGRYDRRVRDAVAAAGYRGACTMNSWAATAGSHALELPRTAVLHYMDAEMLAAELAASRSRVRRAVLRACRAAAAPVRRLRS